MVVVQAVVVAGLSLCGLGFFGAGSYWVKSLRGPRSTSAMYLVGTLFILAGLGGWLVGFAVLLGSPLGRGFAWASCGAFAVLVLVTELLERGSRSGRRRNVASATGEALERWAVLGAGTCGAVCAALVALI
ncbi:hypothetical protein [Cellulosimicrobium protaetiae]